MKKNIWILLTTAVLFFAFLGGCSDPVGGSAGSSEIINETGGNGLGDGISNTDSIKVENGNIIVNVDASGNLQINGENVQLTVFENNAWVLKSGVVVSLKDNHGNEITGSLSVDAANGHITFLPDNPLNVELVYTITLSVNGHEYTATVMLTEDNLGENESIFAGVTMCGKGTYPVLDNLHEGRALFGWLFGENPFKIYIKVVDVEAGANVLLTAHGVYNVEGHLNEVYYQRWLSSGDPVKEYNWRVRNASTFTVGVDEQDSALDTAENDYSFWSTYFEIKIVDSEGNDITSESNAKLVIR